MPKSGQKEAAECLSHTFSASSTNKELGDLLLAARERSGLTQAAIARAIDTSTSFLRKMENGQSGPLWSSILRYATANGMNIQVAVPGDAPQEAEEKLLSHTFTISSTDEELGEFLLTLRKQLGLTQVDAAKKLNTGPAALRRIEKGLVSPRWGNVLRYATANGRKMQLDLIPFENT